jgi:hypothetical protein
VSVDVEREELPASGLEPGGLGPLERIVGRRPGRGALGGRRSRRCSLWWWGDCRRLIRQRILAAARGEGGGDERRTGRRE